MRNNCFKGEGGCFGLTTSTAPVMSAGSTYLFNTVYNNNSNSVCCSKFIHLNIGTGEFTIGRSGRYLITLDTTITPAAGTQATLIGGNGKTIPINQYTQAGGTRSIELKRGHVFKVVNTGTVAPAFEIGTDLPVDVATITITYESAIN